MTATLNPQTINVHLDTAEGVSGYADIDLSIEQATKLRDELNACLGGEIEPMCAQMHYTPNAHDVITAAVDWRDSRMRSPSDYFTIEARRLGQAVDRWRGKR